MNELRLVHNIDNDYELCLDEVGRGCLFGDVYVACVVLPKDYDFDKTNIKDSKKFTSRTKLKNVANYIKEKSLFWDIQSISSEIIDEVNILQAVMKGMHNSITNVLKKIDTNKRIELLIDGNYFNRYKDLNHICIKQGDAKYVGIAAASILAKDARDQYIEDLCNEHEELDLCYNLKKNVGYATKDHLNGIKEHGITNWHRKTFGPCKNCDKIKNIV